jgi:lipoate-protein ligase A
MDASWKIIDSDYQTGKYNMDFDLKLVEKCKSNGTSFLRFYRWKPFAISLGYNQSKVKTGKKINYNKCKDEGIDVVDRPTGGRAVLHSEELTYSVVLKSEKDLNQIYFEISSALLDGIKMIDNNNEFLQKLSLTLDTPDLLKLMKTGMYNLCFASAVKHEINLNGKKLVGSAQRRINDITLQHGSVLIGNHHKNIVNYLNNLSIAEKLKLQEELINKTTCLDDILKREVSYEEVRDGIKKGFEEKFFKKTSEEI